MLIEIYIIKWNYASIKFDNNTSESVDEFRYLGTILTNQNSLQDEIKSRLTSGNSCYLLVQNLSFPV